MVLPLTSGAVKKRLCQRDKLFSGDRRFAKEAVCCVGEKVKHSDKGLKFEMSVFQSFTVANLPYWPCG